MIQTFVTKSRPANMYDVKYSLNKSIEIEFWTSLYLFITKITKPIL